MLAQKSEIRDENAIQKDVVKRNKRVLGDAGGSSSTTSTSVVQKGLTTQSNTGIGKPKGSRKALGNISNIQIKSVDDAEIDKPAVQQTIKNQLKFQILPDLQPSQVDTKLSILPTPIENAEENIDSDMICSGIDTQDYFDRALIRAEENYHRKMNEQSKGSTRLPHDFTNEPQELEIDIQKEIKLLNDNIRILEDNYYAPSVLTEPFTLPDDYLNHDDDEEKE